MLKLGKLGKFDIKNPPEGVWATFSEGVRFKVRKLTAEAAKAIRKPFIKMEMELDPVTRRMVPAEKLTDEEKFNDALASYMIEAFEGVGDEDGNLLSDNVESRRMIFNVPQLRDWIWGLAQSVEIAAANLQESEVKNS